MNYRSVTIFGKPVLVEIKEQKLQVMEIISEHTIPGRWAEARDSQEREIKMAGVISMDIDAASAKVSAGMPDDEDDDYDIPIWAGVLPITSTIGQLQSDDRLLPDVEPSDAMRALQGRVL